MKVSACCALALLCASPAFADDGISTDRPDVTESSTVVGKGRFQLETSFAGERWDHDGVRERNRSTPTLLRYGLGETTELRFETDGSLRSTVDGATASGYADWSVGVKWHLRDAHEGAPALGVLLHVDADTGSAAFRGNGLRPSLRGVAEWDLPNDMSLGVMSGVVIDRRADGGRFASTLFTASLGKDWNERVHSFIEFAAPTIASARNGGSQTLVDFGASYQLTKDSQVDIAVSRGTNRNTPDWGWTTGLSVRF
ncbi:MAG: transporter [Telluria sp.]